jgi:hypothetical protein
MKSQERKPHRPRRGPDSPRSSGRCAPRGRIEGRSVGDFVVATAQEAARKTVAEVEAIRLSREAQEQFVSMLLNPPPPSDALLRALERHRTLIVE